MTLEYLGHSCFCLQSKKGTRVLTDPYTKVGYELPDGVIADIILVSHGHFDHNYTQGVKNAVVKITKAGRYEYDDIVVNGFVCDHDEKGGVLRGKNIVNTIYVDGLKICHLGDLGEACSDELIGKIGKVDVLLIPVGGTYTIDSTQAKEYVERIQPKIVIPMHYKPQDGTLDITDEKAFLSQFERVVYVKKNTAIDLHTYIADKMQILFMERKENA